MTAAYKVEVSWSTRFAGVFKIGTSRIGSTDVISGDFGTNSFDDITSDVKSVSIRRGRSSDMQTMDQGSCTLRLKDTTGKYNPENASSSLAGYLLPMRPVRVTATYSGTAYTLFYGFISRIEHDPSPSVKESTIEAVDLTAWLSLVRPTIGTLTNQTVGALLLRLVGALDIDKAKWSDLDPGGTVPSFAATGTATILSLMSDLLEVDRGMLFVAGSGKVTYRDRARLWRRQTAAATFTSAMVSGLQSTITTDGLLNQQSVTRTGGTAQVASNAASQKRYGVRQGTAIDSSYLASDGQALSLAQFLVAVGRDPMPPARQLVLWNDTEARLLQQLGRELGDYVTVSETAGGTSFSGWVAAIEHEITQGGRIHRSTMAVQKRVRTYLTIGSSKIGSTDIIGY